MDKGIKTSLRNVLGVVVGVLVGGVTIAMVQMLGHQVYPVTVNIDFNDKEAMATFMQSLPTGSLLFVIVAYIVGSVVAGAVAAFIGRGARVRHALVAGAFLLIAGIINLMAIPHPLWFNLLTILVFLPAAWLGGRLVAGARQQA